jgi:hypothetical protein
LGLLNGFFDTSVFAAAKGLADIAAGIPSAEGVAAFTKGFEGAGDVDLLGGSSATARGSANRTCLLLNVPREGPLPPLPVTVALVWPLRCSRFAAFLTLSDSKLSEDEFSVGDVPECLELE